MEDVRETERENCNETSSWASPNKIYRLSNGYTGGMNEKNSLKRRHVMLQRVLWEMQLLHGIKASIDLCVWSENIYFPDLLDSTTIQLDLSHVVVCTCNPSHSYTSQHQQLRTNIAIYNPGHSNFFLSLQRVHRWGNVIIRSYDGGSSVVGLERDLCILKHSRSSMHILEAFFPFCFDSTCSESHIEFFISLFSFPCSMLAGIILQRMQ